MKKQSKTFLDRIKKFQKEQNSDGQELFIVEKPIDLFYLTGLKLSLGYLFLSSKKACLFVDGRYFEAASKQSPVPVQELSDENQQSFIKGAKTLQFDKSTTTYSRYEAIKRLCRPVKCKVVAKPGLIQGLRLIKDEGEIRLMKKSARFAYDAYSYAKKKLKTGITEIEIAKQLEIYCLKNGAEKMSFEPIIAFGKNSALPHHHPGKTKLKANDIVLFDLGVVLENYCSDMTRVVFVGKEDPKLKKFFEVNRAAQIAALNKCKPGVALKELDLAARSVMKSAGLEEYFIHSLGHGVGLEIHESPRIKFDHGDRNLILKPGMAITIEPGLYLPGKGGVRYEDTVVITQKGYTNLYPEK